MFTGIITDIGSIVSTEVKSDGKRAAIATRYDTDTLAIGASVACAGVCLTVVDKTSGQFTVDISQETLDCTTLGAWNKGTRINLERALCVGDELGGHIVTGHVDGVAMVTGIAKQAEHWQITAEATEQLASFIAQKGSVTLDGVSLTVNDTETMRFQVNIIPHTLQQTTLSDLQEGDVVNLEIDPLARYIARQMEIRKG